MAASVKGKGEREKCKESSAQCLSECSVSSVVESQTVGTPTTEARRLHGDTENPGDITVLELLIMRAVKIISFGGVEGLQVVEVDDAPKPTADRVRVRVRAAGLNRADILQRLGRYPAPPGYPQDIPGLEFAGEVESAGEDARFWKVGDRITDDRGATAR